jgi:hypothetical protein
MAAAVMAAAEMVAAVMVAVAVPRPALAEAQAVAPARRRLFQAVRRLPPRKRQGPGSAF